MHCTRVASPVAKQLKTLSLSKFENSGKISKMGEGRICYPVSLPVIKLWYYWSVKTDIQVFSSYSVLFDFLILFHKFRPRLCEAPNMCTL